MIRSKRAPIRDDDDDAGSPVPSYGARPRVAGHASMARADMIASSQKVTPSGSSYRKMCQRILKTHIGRPQYRNLIHHQAGMALSGVMFSPSSRLKFPGVGTTVRPGRLACT